MCNRYENEKPAWAWSEIISMPLRVTDEAKAWEPHEYMAPQTDGLCIVMQGDEWTLRTAHWSFLMHKPAPRITRGMSADDVAAIKAKPLPKPGALFNARSDRSPKHLLPRAYQHESGTSPKGLAKTWLASGLQFCWMPATAWLECPSPKTWIRMHLSGEPFLLAGICGVADGKFRMAMTMTETPEGLSAIRAGHTRMPLAFGVDAVGQEAPRPLHERIEVSPV